MDTNKVLLTVDDIFRMKGVQPGYEPTDFEYEQAVRTADDLNKKKLESIMMPAGAPVPPPRYMSLTNAEGRVIDVMIKPDGEPMVVEPKVIHAQTGAYTLSNPTNAAPIIDPRTGQQVMGYAADPMMGGMPSPAPLAGGQMTATNAPTAAPVQTPAPSPAAPQLREGMRVRQGGITYVITNGVPVPVTGP